MVASRTTAAAALSGLGETYEPGRTHLKGLRISSRHEERLAALGRGSLFSYLQTRAVLQVPSNIRNVNSRRSASEKGSFLPRRASLFSATRFSPAPLHGAPLLIDPLQPVEDTELSAQAGLSVLRRKILDGGLTPTSRLYQSAQAAGDVGPGLQDLRHRFCRKTSRVVLRLLGYRYSLSTWRHFYEEKGYR